MFLDGIDYKEYNDGYQILKTSYFPTSYKDCEYFGSHFSITKDGMIYVWEGYCFDGASGPTIDTDNSFEAACFHDIMYALIRMGVIPNTYWNRRKADLMFYKALRKDGMSWLRANAWFVGVRAGGWAAI